MYHSCIYSFYKYTINECIFLAGCKRAAAISKYLAINYPVECKANKNKKIIIDRELKKFNSSREDEILVASPIFPTECNNVKNIDNHTNPTVNPSLKKGQNKKKKLNRLKNEHYDFDNWKQRIKDLKYQLQTGNCFKSSLSQFIKKVRHNHSLKSKRKKNLYMYDECMDFNCNDANNNSLEKDVRHSELNIQLTNAEFPETSDGRRCSTHYDTVGNLCLMFSNEFNVVNTYYL